MTDSSVRPSENEECVNGHTVAAGSKFCPQCGSPVAATPNASSSSAQQMPPTASTDTGVRQSAPAEQPASSGNIGSPSRTPITSKRNVLIGGIVLAAIVVTVFVVSNHGTGSGSSQVQVAHGSLTLTGGGGYTTETPCHGTGNSLIDNSDMTAATPIKILDAAGTIIGTGSLGEGAIVPGNDGGQWCRFTFDVPLDSTSTHYQIVVADREPFGFDDPTSVELSLG